MKRIFNLFLGLLVLIVGLSFAVLNAEKVPLNYYLGQSELPLSLLLVLAMAFGALLGVISTLGLLLAQKSETARLRRKHELCEQELKNLRQLPIQNKH